MPRLPETEKRTLVSRLCTRVVVPQSQSPDSHVNFNLIAVVESSKPVAAVEASQATLSQAAVAPVTKKADGEDSLSPFSSDDENAAANKPRKCCFSHFGVVLHGSSH